MVSGMARHCPDPDGSNFLQDLILGFESLYAERLVDFVSSHGIYVDCGVSHDGNCVSGRLSNMGCLCRLVTGLDYVFEMLSA
jgi:hypothetical protein